MTYLISQIRFPSLIGLLAPLVFTVFSAGTAAANGPEAGSWFIQNGAVIIDYERKSSVTLNGAPAPALEAAPADDMTLGNALGYYLTPNISAMLVLGVAAETNVNSHGTRLGRMNYGAPSFVVDYHFTQFGALQPFVGVGVSWIHIFETEDDLITDLEVDDTVGFILRAGAEVMLSEKFGMFVTVNKIFASTEARGSVGASPIHADIDLDPWIFQFGITNRF